MKGSFFLTGTKQPYLLLEEIFDTGLRRLILIRHNSRVFRPDTGNHLLVPFLHIAVSGYDNLSPQPWDDNDHGRYACYPIPFERVASASW